MPNKSEKIKKLKEINKRIDDLISVMETEVFIKNIDYDKNKKKL